MRILSTPPLDEPSRTEAQEAALLPRGRLVRKKSHRGVYWYLERSEGGGKRQVALGPESPELLRWIQEVRELWAERASAARRGRR